MTKPKLKTLLTVDVGNTTISLGVLSAKNVDALADVETRLPTKKLRKILNKVLNSLKKDFLFEGVIICSVVPPVLSTVKAVIGQNLKLKPLVVGRDVAVPLINRYRNPKQVGQDRLVGAYAAMKFYGIPAIVIDFGTAITFDVVSGKKEYLGGIIVPGIRLSAESLFHKTALIPRIDIVKPGPLIGRDTQESVLSGIFHGYGAMSRGLIALLAKKIKTKPKVIVTGGYTPQMKKYIAREITAVDRYLVFKGLYLLWKESRLEKKS
jgi:type III pantothenate kinase